jgi:glycosyltransferase involved in cell wall biosynthesis
MKLSIITINLNNAEGLNKTLKSIDCQTFTDYEQIIIDGGSSDDSVKIINHFSQIIKQHFIWVSEPDNGIYNAQNKGIKRASGEYCLFLNSGDYLVNETVLEQVFTIEPIADVIYGNLVVLFNKKIIGISKGKEKITFLDIYSSTIKHQAAFIKKELFEKYGLFDETLRIAADWKFFLKTVGFHDVYLQYIDVNIACFDNNGISNNNPELCKVESQKILDQCMPTLMQKDYLLLEKYQGIRYIDHYKLSWFLFRCLAKITKVFGYNNKYDT